MKNPLSKRVQIDVSLARPHSTREEFPRLVVFGIVKRWKRVRIESE